MYKLRFTPETEEELRQQLTDEALVPTVVIDRGVQCNLPGAPQGRPESSAGAHRTEAGCDGLPYASEGLFRPLAFTADRRAERTSARSLAGDSVDADGAWGTGGLVSPRLAPSPSPTTWLDEVGVCEPASAEASPGGDVRGVERAVVPFYSGQPCAELCAGSVGFYRYESPAGVLGLSPPPLRSSLLALLNVPASMTSAELLQFIGAYLRCVRYARLVRDASRPHVHCVLLHLVSPAVAERFRRDFHGRRFNSLEPEVLLVVHVAAIELAPPQPPPALDVRVGVTLVVTTLERGLDGALQTAGTPNGWSAGEAPTPPLVKGRSAPDWPSSRLEERNLQAAIRRSLRPTSPPATAPLNDVAATSGAGASSWAADAPPGTPLPSRAFRVAAQLRPTLAGRGRLRPVPPAPPLPPADVSVSDALSRGEAVIVDPAGGMAGKVLVAGGGPGCDLGGAVELPMCAVCLERLDPEVSGVMTILCNHAFHCECLRRWTDSSCPVCRHVSDEASAATTCELCGTSDSLWICLVCGHVGCGRYGCGAGVLHNERTSHNFAMDLDSQRVWDYAGDNYVHRLIQNKVDGKLVELPHPGGRAGAEPGGEGWRRGGGGSSSAPQAELEMKQRRLEDEHEAVVHEYSLLLTGQLEVQRQHFEEQLEMAQRAQAAQLAERDAAVAEERAELARRREEVTREAKAMARRAAAAEAVLAAARSDLEFNRELNAQLRANQVEWAARLAAAAAREATLEGQKEELEEQLRDMSFHLEAQLKIMGGGDGAHEMTGGNVMPGEMPQGRKQGKRRVGRG